MLLVQDMQGTSVAIENADGTHTLWLVNLSDEPVEAQASGTLGLREPLRLDAYEVKEVALGAA